MKVIFLGLLEVTGTITLVIEKAAKNKLRHKYMLQRMEAPHQSSFFLLLSISFRWTSVSRTSFSSIFGKKYLPKFLEELRL